MITQEYGNMIFTDSTISKKTIYHFNDMFELKEFWRDNQDAEQEGNWQAHLDRLTVEHTAFVDAEEYFEYIESLGEEE